MRSFVHMPIMVEVLLDHPVAALLERPVPRLTRPWPVHLLLAVDATVADLGHATVNSYTVEGRTTPLHDEAEHVELLSCYGSPLARNYRFRSSQRCMPRASLRTVRCGDHHLLVRVLNAKVSSVRH
ncbi:hypothetical protein ZWY2020_037875 [Hordeum vulgare]|nr:hypothetical protein ZWY2020_037875 [Hordeum vulgare]